MKKNKKLYISGMVLMAAVMASNVINFFFNALLGRFVTLEDFGIIILITNILYIVNIFLNALAATVNHQVAKLHAGSQKEDSHHFITHTSQLIFKVSIAFAVLWLIFSSQIAAFFQIETMIIMLFTPLFIFYPYAAIARGFFQGKFSFIKSAALILFEPITKLISVGFLLFYQLHSHAYISLYISAVITGLIASVIILRNVSVKTDSKFRFPRKFYLNAVFVGCSTISFLALDVILVKHFLNPTSAGQYSLLSLIGKTIYFLGTLFNMFTISVVSREIGVIRKKFVPFYYLLLGALLTSTVGYIVFGLFGFYFNPLIFGNKAVSILPYTNLYIVSMVFFTIGSMLLTYHLAKKDYVFSLAGLISSVLIIAGIVLYHADLQQVVQIIFYVSILYFTVLFTMHIKHNFFSKARIKPY